MTDLREWLRGRHPAAPTDLAERVDAALEGVPAAGEAGAAPYAYASGAGEGSGEAHERVGRLSGAGREALERAVDRPGRVRATAFELLVADALVTYACEAALEADRPLEALDAIVEVGRTR